MKIGFYSAAITALVLIGRATAGNSFSLESVKAGTEHDLLFVTISGEGNPQYEAYELRDPDRIVVRFSNAAKPDKPVAISYTEPVKRIEVQPDFQAAFVLKVICEVDGLSSYDISEENGLIVITAPLIGGTPPTKTAGEEKSPAWMAKRISVDFENNPLATALSLMAKQNGFDVVTSGLEDHRVTARLSNVAVGDALAALLNVSGFVYYTVGDIVVVKSIAEEAPAEMVTRIFKLNYLDSRQIEPQIKNMLSSKGKVEIVSAGQTLGEGSSARYAASVIAVTDLAAVIPRVEDFVSKIDIKPKQVAISVKLVETTISDDRSLGLDWEKSIMARITGAEQDVYTNNQSNERLSGYSTIPLNSESFTWGTLTISEVSALLEYLHSTGESRLLSSPSVTTTDGKPAVIDVVTTIPIQTINRFSEGAIIQDIATFQYKDVGITLSVTPVINRDGYITLRCLPSVEEITGWVGPDDNQQPITAKRSVDTDVIVKTGETLVIGGLMKENTIENVNGVWLISDIPVLGELFKHRSRQKSKTELMIFITPTIIP